MSSSSLLKILLASLFSAVSLCGHSQNVVTLVHDDVLRLRHHNDSPVGRCQALAPVCPAVGMRGDGSKRL